jgi:hypothetical protein
MYPRVQYRWNIQSGKHALGKPIRVYTMKSTIYRPFFGVKDRERCWNAGECEGKCHVTCRISKLGQFCSNKEWKKRANSTSHDFFKPNFTLFSKGKKSMINPVDSVSQFVKMFVFSSPFSIEQLVK